MNSLNDFDKIVGCEATNYIINFGKVWCGYLIQQRSYHLPNSSNHDFPQKIQTLTANFSAIWALTLMKFGFQTKNNVDITMVYFLQRFEIFVIFRILLVKSIEKNAFYRNISNR